MARLDGAVGRVRPIRFRAARHQRSISFHSAQSQQVPQRVSCGSGRLDVYTKPFLEQVAKIFLQASAFQTHPPLCPSRTIQRGVGCLATHCNSHRRGPLRNEHPVHIKLHSLSRAVHGADGEEVPRRQLETVPTRIPRTAFELHLEPPRTAFRAVSRRQKYSSQLNCVHASEQPYDPEDQTRYRE